MSPCQRLVAVVVVVLAGSIGAGCDDDDVATGATGGTGGRTGTAGSGGGGDSGLGQGGHDAGDEAGAKAGQDAGLDAGSTGGSDGLADDAAGGRDAIAADASADGAGSQDGGTFALAGLDDVCGSGGPTGRQLLALVRASYAGSYTPPSTNRPAGYPWTGPTAPVAITLGAAYKTGAITCTIDDYVCPGGGVPCRVRQPPSVAVQLEITCKTGDGLLNEDFAVMAHYGPGGTTVGWEANLPASKVAGSYPLVADDRAHAYLAFHGQFAGAQVTGNISDVGPSISLPGGGWTASAAP